MSFLYAYRANELDGLFLLCLLRGIMNVLYELLSRISTDGEVSRRVYYLCCLLKMLLLNISNYM